MSLEQLEQSVLQLPREERRRFARWFYENENEILEPGDGDEPSPAVRVEILRRRDELVANPGMAVPVTDEWFESLKRKLSNAGVGQASPR